MKKHLKTILAVIVTVFVTNQINAAGILTTTYSVPKDQSLANYFVDLSLQAPNISIGGVGSFTLPFSQGTLAIGEGVAVPLQITSYATQTNNTYTFTPGSQNSFLSFNVTNFNTFSFELSSTTGSTVTLSNLSFTSTSDNQTINVGTLTSSNGDFVGTQLTGFQPGPVQVTGNLTITDTNGMLPASGDSISFIGTSIAPEPSPLAFIGGGLLAFFGFILLRKRQTTS